MNPAEIQALTGRHVIDLVAEISGLRNQLAVEPEVVFDRLGIGRTNGYQLLRQGIIPGRKLGQRWIVPVPALVLWLISCDIEEEPENTEVT